MKERERYWLTVMAEEEEREKASKAAAETGEERRKADFNTDAMVKGAMEMLGVYDLSPSLFIFLFLPLLSCVAISLHVPPSRQWSSCTTMWFGILAETSFPPSPSSPFPLLRRPPPLFSLLPLSIPL